MLTCACVRSVFVNAVHSGVYDERESETRLQIIYFRHLISCGKWDQLICETYLRVFITQKRVRVCVCVHMCEYLLHTHKPRKTTHLCVQWAPPTCAGTDNLRSI